MKDELKNIGRASQEVTEIKGVIETKTSNPELFDEPPAYVSYSSGINYNSKKVTITRPCKNIDKDIDNTFKKIVKDVESKLSKLSKSKDKSDKEFCGGTELTFIDKE